MEDLNRQTGQTTRQIQAAPQGAVFIWVNNKTGYLKFLVRKLGRTDLEIHGPTWLDYKVLSCKPRPIVVDHATRLTGRQIDNLYLRGTPHE